MESVPYVDFSNEYREIRDEILDTIDNVLYKGSYILGNEVTEFEEKFAAYCGMKYAVGVANGTVSLYMIMKSLGIGEGDEVITVPNTFVATVSAIVHTGAIPVFVDVGNDFNMDANKIENVLSDKTKAIIPVHLCGRIANMNEINSVAQKHNLYVIEDAAQAVGAEYFNKKAGSFGIAASFSLHPLKILGAYGDGGIIVTNDYNLYTKLLRFRNHGLINRNEVEFWGLNARLDTLQAAILLVKLKYLDENIRIRRENAKFYTENLREFVKVPIEQDYEYHVYHTYIIQTDCRDQLQESLLKEGIEIKVHYPICIHQQIAAKCLNYKWGDFPNVEKQSQHILTLPNYPSLSYDNRVKIVNTVIKTIKTLYSALP